jgi:hypothetical protein
MKKIFKYSILFIVVVFLINSCFVGDQVQIVGSKIESDTNFNVFIIEKDKMNFGVSTEKPTDSDFYVNSNFFNSAGPIGLVVMNRTRIQKRSVGGGYFYVVNGKPYVRAKECPKMTDFASQSILWGIDNGIANEALIQRPISNLKRHRTILGEDSEGRIMLIASNSLGMVSIGEIVEFAQSKGMVEGILLDGASSVDYKFTDGIDEASLKTIPSTFKKFMNIEEPKTYIYGNFKNK